MLLFVLLSPVVVPIRESDVYGCPMNTGRVEGPFRETTTRKGKNGEQQGVQHVETWLQVERMEPSAGESEEEGRGTCAYVCM